MSNKRTEYFDEIEVSEGQNFSVIFRKNNSEKIKVFEITESGECIVNKLIVKDCVVDSNSIKSDISRLSSVDDELKKNIDSLEGSVNIARRNSDYHKEAIENLCKHLNISTEIIHPSPFTKMYGYQDLKELGELIKDMK